MGAVTDGKTPTEPCKPIADLVEWAATEVAFFFSELAESVGRLQAKYKINNAIGPGLIRVLRCTLARPWSVAIRHCHASNDPKEPIVTFVRKMFDSSMLFIHQVTRVH